MSNATTLREELNEYVGDLTGIKERVQGSELADKETLVADIETTLNQLQDNTLTDNISHTDLINLTTRVEHLTNLAETKLLAEDAKKVHAEKV